MPSRRKHRRRRRPRQRRMREGVSDRDDANLMAKPRPSASPLSFVLSEPSGGVREQRKDQTGLRSEMAAQRLRAAILARDLVQEPLELGYVTVNRLLEASVGSIFARDLVERLLASRRV